MVDPTGHSAGAIGALKGIWGAALAEPTPYGEIIAAIATIFLGGVIIGEAISNSNSVRDDSETKEKIKDVPKPQPSPIPKKNNKKNKNDNDRTPPPPRPENREKEKPKIEFPGYDASKPPGKDFEWRGSGEPGSPRGSWYNPKTGESLHPDLNHPHGIELHWDYKSPEGINYRIFADGSVVPK
nr:polymorphic toxin type 37 domain-containing protein [Guopingia tenuis]